MDILKANPLLSSLAKDVLDLFSGIWTDERIKCLGTLTSFERCQRKSVRDAAGLTEEKRTGYLWMSTLMRVFMNGKTDCMSCGSPVVSIEGGR